MLGNAKTWICVQAVATSLCQHIYHFFLQTGLWKADVEAGNSDMLRVSSKLGERIGVHNEFWGTLAAWLCTAQLSPSWKCACSARISVCSSTLTATSSILSLLNVCRVVFRLFCLLNTNGCIHTKLSLLPYSQKRLKLLSLQVHHYPTVLDLCSASDSLSLLGSNQ